MSRKHRKQYIIILTLLIKYVLQVSAIPKPKASFLEGLPPTGLNSTVAVAELLNIAKKYEKQLKSAIASPQLNRRFISTLEPKLTSQMV